MHPALQSHNVPYPAICPSVWPTTAQLWSATIPHTSTRLCRLSTNAAHRSAAATASAARRDGKCSDGINGDDGCPSAAAAAATATTTDSRDDRQEKEGKSARQFSLIWAWAVSHRADAQVGRPPGSSSMHQATVARSQEQYLKQSMAPPPGPPVAPPPTLPQGQGIGEHEPWADALDEIDPRELAMGRFRARQEALAEVFGPEPISLSSFSASQRC